MFNVLDTSTYPVSDTFDIDGTLDDDHANANNQVLIRRSPNFNFGFSKRVVALNDKTVKNVFILLNRYDFFERFSEKIFPSGRVVVEHGGAEGDAGAADEGRYT